MRFFRNIVLFSLLFIGISFANEIATNSKKEPEKKIEYAFIDIDSNVKDTPIFLDNKEIGKTPMKAFRVEAGKELLLKGIANKEYYDRDIIKKVTLIKNTQKKLFYKFEKAQAKLFLIGDKAQLFINNKFIKELNEENRVTNIDAGKNIEIYLEDGYKSRMLFKDIKANQFYDVKYTLLNIPKDVRLFTTTVENLMWEDTKHASGVKLDWDGAKEYCEDLDLAGIKDWQMPSLDQLQRLEAKYKDKMYHGYGKTFYWSDKTSESKNGIWNYASAVNFDTGRVTTPIKEIGNGYVRCVKELGAATQIVVNEEKTQQLKEQKPDLGYDPALTKDLDKYMLK